MSRFGNKRKTKFIGSFPESAPGSLLSDIAGRSKFNFSYFDPSQDAGQDFREWTHSQLYKLLDKLKHYSRHSLKHWKTTAHQGKQNTLEIYGSFPNRSLSDFVHPRHVPHDVEWGRFRLEGTVRLIGFVIPDSLSDKKDKDGNRFCTNTFYVVFLDKDHRFYKQIK